MATFMPGVQDQPVETTRPAAADRAGDKAPDPLARLKKMSTTAGVGSQEYVAVNPMAVATLLLGFATLLVFLHDVLLLIPLAGVVCAVIAWRQIHNSNGTQTGRLMVLAGLVLCVTVGGGRLAWNIIGGWASRADKAEIQRQISELGTHLRHQEYQAGRDMFTQRFKERVSPQKFADAFAFKDQQGNPVGGGIKGMEWNGRVEFEDDPQAKTRLAYTMAFFSFNNAAEPGRVTVVLLKEGDRWMIDDMPLMFPREKKPAAGARGGAAAPSGAAAPGAAGNR
jgi:hypothetical protein